MKGKEFDKINKALEMADEAMMDEWLENHKNSEEVDFDDIQELVMLVVNFNTFVYSMWIVDNEELPDEAKELRDTIMNKGLAGVYVKKEKNGGMYA